MRTHFVWIILFTCISFGGIQKAEAGHHSRQHTRKHHRYKHQHKHQTYRGHSRYRVPSKAKPRPENPFFLGIRATAGFSLEEEQLLGIGAFLRFQSRFFGLEASIDSAAVAANGKQVANRTQILGAGLLYLNPEKRNRVFALAGGGASIEQRGNQIIVPTLQAGAGVEIDLNEKTVLSLDARFLADIGQSPEVMNQFITGNLSLSFLF